MINIKYFIKITNKNEKSIFQGKPITLPMKEKYITEKCIELFSDPDPCIIHQSYASQKLVDYFISLFPSLPLIHFSLSGYSKKLDFINIPNIEKYYLTIEVK